MGEDGLPLQLGRSIRDILITDFDGRFAERDLNELERVLAASRAAETFKNAVRSYCETGNAEHIRVDGMAPRIKVRRLLTHMLATEPHLPIERVALRGRSGCSDFVGTVHVHTASGTHTYAFVWDCRVRAEQEGWRDCFGFPDQIRAAMELDWRCFVHWEPIGSKAAQS